MSAVKTRPIKFKPMRLAVSGTLCPGCGKVSLTVDKTDPSVLEPCAWCGWVAR